MYLKLKDFIYPKAHLNNFNSSNNSFYIKETDPSAKCRRIDLLKFESQSNFFAFALDSSSVKCGTSQKISPFFTNKKGLDKGNDALIFTRIKDNDYVFICELKDGGKVKDFIPQFKSSTCFIEYIKSILKRFYGIKTDNLIFKYIVFSCVAPQLDTTDGKFISTKIDDFDVYHVNCTNKNYYIESFI